MCHSKRRELLIPVCHMRGRCVTKLVHIYGFIKWIIQLGKRICYWCNFSQRPFGLIKLDFLVYLNIRLNIRGVLTWVWDQSTSICMFVTSKLRNECSDFNAVFFVRNFIILILHNILLQNWTKLLGSSYTFEFSSYHIQSTGIRIFSQ